jgi:hypothetical protein
MPLIKARPNRVRIVRHICRLQEPNRDMLVRYARLIGEAFDLLQALNTGHAGSLSTIHANSAEQALARLASCVVQSGVELPYQAVRYRKHFEALCAACDESVRIIDQVFGAEWKLAAR